MIGIMSSFLETLRASIPDSAARMVALKDGALLFRQGDRPSWLYAIESGQVDLMRRTAAGSAVRLHSALAGEVVAEASLFSEAYHCDAVATQPLQAIAFDLGAVRAACQGTPDLAMTLVRHLSMALRDARRLVELRSITPLTERLLARLSELADPHGHLPADLRMVDIAREIGASPEATYRAVSSLEASGKVERPARGVVWLALNERKKGSEAPS
ncbi:Crp/Fnr family transcriptional regulator [Vannielia sp. SX4]|uniref:Crp/Fnr family transcriptional regulator n=1 Tax=Vannielia sp. SX4 TaxID=3463852 RepID=UPI004059D8D9